MATGRTQVLGEARNARIPVLQLDRDIDPSGKSPCLAAVTSDSAQEGTVADQWLAQPRVPGRARSTRSTARSAHVLDQVYAVCDRITVLRAADRR